MQFRVARGGEYSHKLLASHAPNNHWNAGCVRTASSTDGLVASYNVKERNRPIVVVCASMGDEN